MAHLSLAHTEENEGARAFQQHEGEILTGHAGRGAVVDAVRSRDVSRDVRRDRGFALVIDRRRVHPGVVRLR